MGKSFVSKGKNTAFPTSSKRSESKTNFVISGFVRYTIVRQQMVAPGMFRYAVKELRSRTDNDEGDRPNLLTLDGARGRHNPLAQIRNCELLIAGNNEIVGINLDGDCALKKTRSS